MSKIRALILSNMYPRALGGMFIHNQAHHLISAGCEIRVIVPVPFVPKILRSNNGWKVYSGIPKNDTIDLVPVYYPRYFRLPGKWFHSISCYSQCLGAKNLVSSLINEFKPNILHAHAATAPGYLGLLIKKKYNLPLVCSLRGSDINAYPYYDKCSMHLTKKLISGADQLLSVSNALKKTALSIEQPKRDIKVIYNGCDINSFVFNKEDRTKTRNKLGISDKDKVLIFIGSLTEEKGIFELITAFTNIASSKPSLHLVMIGNGPNRSKIQSLLNKNKNANKIRVLGDKPHNEIPNYLSSADIFALPSYTEGLPNVILEAMSCSLPVIATRVGGIPEIITDGKTGLLIEAKSVEALQKSIEHLLNNESLAKALGTAGRINIENRFSWNRNADEVTSTYNEIIARKY